MLSTMAGLELRTYQEDGIRWLKQHQRGLLADEYGLGKTIQAIHAAVPPVLVACPTYLMGDDEWAGAIKRERTGESVAVAQGSPVRRLKALQERADWTIINTEMLRSYGPALKNMYATFIIDESHHVRGHTSKQSREALNIAKRVPNVYLLSATPVVKEVDDLFMQLAILDPRRFTSYWQFVEHYCKVYSNGFAKVVTGVKPEQADAFREMLGNYIIRRRYEDVGLSKPDSIYHTTKITPTVAWRKAYNKLRDEYRLADITFETAGAMVRVLRQMCFELKLEAAQDVLTNNPNTLFYCFYRDSTEDVSRALRIPFVHGEQEPQSRVRLAKSSRALVATLGSLREGINLTHFDTVCFIENSYVPGERTQAVARVVRWSPKIRPVGIYDLEVERSIDTTIKRVSSRRQVDNESVLRAELEKNN